MHVNDEKGVHVQSLSGAACIGDWGKANVCKGLKVPLCLIPYLLLQDPSAKMVNYWEGFFLDPHLYCGILFHWLKGTSTPY